MIYQIIKLFQSAINTFIQSAWGLYIIIGIYIIYAVDSLLLSSSYHSQEYWRSTLGSGKNIKLGALSSDSMPDASDDL